MSQHSMSLRMAGLSALSSLLPSFTDQGLRTLKRAAGQGLLVRGVWSSGPHSGCPLSCADGVVGATRASRFWLHAPERNRFIQAWDAGVLSGADMAAMVEIEQERREQRAVAPARHRFGRFLPRRPAPRPAQAR